jgi:hypothetical protein
VIAGLIVVSVTVGLICRYGCVRKRSSKDEGGVELIAAARTDTDIKGEVAENHAEIAPARLRYIDEPYEAIGGRTQYS